MLPIHIPEGELYDSEKNEFIYIKEQNWKLEHSLISISKWESKWKKSFFEERELSPDELKSYVECMIINPTYDRNALELIDENTLNDIVAYMGDPMTATTFSNQDKKKGRGKKTTTEEIYYLMTQFGINWEAEKWHFNRLMTLIQICDIRSRPPKKIPRRKQLQDQRALNEARRRQSKAGRR